MIATHTATAYLTPLREGGSLPAIVRADNQRLYAMKFTGAGQGRRALIAEVIGGEIARRLGFTVPEIAFLELDPAIGRNERDAEIQDLLQASAGLNFGMAFLDGATTFNPLSPTGVDPDFAARLVWLDAFLTNVDRTARNVNLLVHADRVWLIDHGAALYFHHTWQDPERQAETPFARIRDHVLLPYAERLRDIDGEMRAPLSEALFAEIVAAIPDDWLGEGTAFATPEAYRRAYVAFLLHRLNHADRFVEEADRARSDVA